MGEGERIGLNFELCLIAVFSFGSLVLVFWC
jgi:hypothetical protein